MSLLGNLRVRLTAETEDFRRGLDGARKNVGSFQKELGSFQRSTLANVASFTALAAVVSSSISVANEYDKAQSQLAATAKLTGVHLGFLESTSKAAQGQFKLSAISANGFTIELAKLAGKAGDVGKASAGLEAFLDIGAARGLSADQTLKAVQQSILGIDEGTDKLFSKNPSVLYEEYAAKIGTTAGKLTDQQKAQALLDAAMQDGAKVRGEYQKWLQSSQGQQYLLSQGMEQTQAVLGKALQPALVAIIPIVAKMAEGLQMSIKGWQMIGATLALIPALAKRAWAALRGNAEQGQEDWRRAINSWRDKISEIQGVSSGAVYVPPNLDLSPTAGRAQEGAKKTGRQVARTLFDSLESEWERLRHSVALVRVEVTGTDTERSALELEHSNRMLAIEERRLAAEHKAGIITRQELIDGRRQIEIRRQIAEARHTEHDAAQRLIAEQRAAFERQDALLSHAVDKERILNQAAVTRLGSEGSISDRLELQLSLVERTYQLQRDALQADTRLTDLQLQGELQKLDLAREREQLQLRMNAAVEEELRTIEKQKIARQKALEQRRGIRDQAIGLAGNIVSGGVNGAQIGAALGSMAGSFVPVLAPLASAIGGRLGGLFDKGKPQDQAVSGLQAIERAQRETITAIEQQTERLIDPLSSLFNLPTSFSVPTYMPQFASAGTASGGTSVYHGDTHVTMTFNVSQVQDPEEVKRLAREGVAQALESGRYSSPRRVARY